MHNAHIYLHIWLIDSYLYKNASKLKSSSGIAHIYIANIYENKRILLGHRNLKFGVGVWIYFICDIPNSIMHKLIHLNQTYLFLNHVFHTLNQDDFRPRLKIVLTKKWARASSNFIWKIDSTTQFLLLIPGAKILMRWGLKLPKHRDDFEETGWSRYLLIYVQTLPHWDICKSNLYSNEISDVDPDPEVNNEGNWFNQHWI